MKPIEFVSNGRTFFSNYFLDFLVRGSPISNRAGKVAEEDINNYKAVPGISVFFCRLFGLSAKYQFECMYTYCLLAGLFF